MAFAPEGAVVAVSDRTRGELYLVDLSDRSDAPVRTLSLEGRPTGLAWAAPDRLFVAEYDAGSIAEVAAGRAPPRVLRRIAVGPKPMGLAYAAGRGLLVVCEYGLGEIRLIDAATGEPRAVLPAGRHPYFAAVTPDESLAVVANLLPVGPAGDPGSAATLTLIDLASASVAATLPLPPGSSNVRQVRVSPDGRWAYVVHTLGRTTLPTTQVERGWVNTDALSIIDLGARTRYATVLLDYLTQGAADPWGLALSPDGATAWITLAGVHELARIELASLHAHLAGSPGRDLAESPDATGGADEIWLQIQRGETERDALMDHLTAMYGAGLLSRHPLPVRVPRGLSLSADGQWLAAAGYYSGDLVLLDPATCEVTRRIALGPQPEMTRERYGEYIFHDATESLQHWVSCATCHPDTRADGLNWDLLNDGFGNPKNTKSLLWSDRTPPTTATGVRPNMETSTLKGFLFSHFMEAPERTVDLTRDYLRSLEPEPSPYLVDGELSEAAKLGELVFEQARCAECHPAPLFTDLKTYDVGTRSELDRVDAFDTPTLVEMWRSGPYLHDGSARTIREVLLERNPQGKHGAVGALSETELEALIEYVLSL